ncbi:MAG: hypothetical protein AB2693_21430 [Candidatus Thiodiazotropha sp.]
MAKRGREITTCTITKHLQPLDHDASCVELLSCDKAANAPSEDSDKHRIRLV